MASELNDGYSVAQADNSRDGMPLVPPKERFHFSAVRAEECGLSEEEFIRMTTRDL